MSWREQLKERVFVRDYLMQMILVHLGVILSIPYFSFPAFGFAFLCTAVFGNSMAVFHHVLFSHRGFACHPMLARVGGLFGTLTWRGPFAGPVRYVAVHRVHHAFSDTDSDPHSPASSFFNSLIGWQWYHSPLFENFESYSRFAKGTANDPWLCWLDQNVNFVQFLWGVACFSGGFLFSFLSGEGIASGLNNGIRFLLFGVFMKTIMVVYSASLEDTICHMRGYRNFNTRDSSTNNFLAFAFLPGTVSWHNNHHAFARYASVKYRWWEVDLHLLILRIFEVVGLVSNIKVLNLGEQTVATPVGLKTNLTYKAADP